MPTTVGDLNVKISGDVADLTRKMAAAQKSVAQFGAGAASAGKKAEAAFVGIGRSSGAVPPALKRITDSTRAMTLMQMEAVAMNEALSTTQKKAHISTGLLGREMVTLTRNMMGLNPVVAQAGSMIGQMAIGSGLMIAVLAGTAALAAAWNKFTEDARKAKEALQAQLDVLRAISRERGLPAGGTGEQALGAATARRSEILRRQIELGGDEVYKIKGGAADRELKRLATELQEIERLIVDGTANVASIYREKGEEAARIAEKFAAERVRIAEEAAGAEVRIAQELARKLATVDAGTRGTVVGLTGGSPFTAEGKAKLAATQRQREQFVGMGGSLTKVAVPAGGAIGAGAGMGGLAQVGAALKAQVMGLAASFGPLAAIGIALKPVFGGLLEKLGPVLEKLAEPLAQIGRIVGGILAPVLEMLEKPLAVFANLVALLLEPLRFFVDMFVARIAPALKVFTFALEAVTWAFSWVEQAIGVFIEGLGKFVDKIVPDWISKVGKEMAGWGQEMQENAKSARAGTLAAEKGAKALDALTTSAQNMPRAVNLALLRYRASGAGMVPGVTGGGAGGTPPIIINIEEIVTAASTGRQLVGDIAREVARNPNTPDAIRLRLAVMAEAT